MRYTKIDDKAVPRSEVEQAQQELNDSYVSIQVAATCQGEGDIFVVESNSPHATHWSVYLRTSSGMADWQKDFPIKSAPNMAKASAILFAAELSQKFFIPLEKIV